MQSAALRIEDTLTDAEIWSNALLDEGYCIIPGAIAKAKVRALHTDLAERFERTPFCEGGFYGPRTKRFGGLLKRSPHAEAFGMHPLILDIVSRVLGPHCDTVQFNFSQALALYPGAPLQAPHRDQDMWRGVPGAAEYLINVMWPLGPFTKDNGGTVVWPRSNKRMDEAQIDMDEAIHTEMQPGDALLFLGSTLHGAGANITDQVRTGFMFSYCLGWLRPYENQFLSYPPEVARQFSPETAAMIGYQQHKPNLGNFEGVCPSVLLGADVPEYLAAKDALAPQHVEMLKDFIARRDGQCTNP